MQTLYAAYRFSTAMMLLALAVWITLRPAAARAAGSTGKANVLVLLTEDQGYGDLSCHGKGQPAADVSIQSVELLGSEAKLKGKKTDTGLAVSLPNRAPTQAEIAAVLRLLL